MTENEDGNVSSSESTEHTNASENSKQQASAVSNLISGNVTSSASAEQTNHSENSNQQASAVSNLIYWVIFYFLLLNVEYACFQHEYEVNIMCILFFRTKMVNYVYHCMKLIIFELINV